MATSTLGSGTLVLAGTTSGTTTVTATAVAGTTTLTLPAATDTLVGKATTDTLTNKTLTSPTITGGALNGTVGATTPATGAFTTLSASGNVTLGDASTDTLNVGNGDLVKDASGNLGLGVTPSAWGFSGQSAFQVKNASFAGYQNRAYVGANNYTNSGGNSIYIASDFATNYVQASGQHQWYNAPSGTAGNAITFTQAMTLDASGKLLVGSTSSFGVVNGEISVKAASGGAGVALWDSGVSSKFQLIAGAGGVNAFGLYDISASAYRWTVDASGNLLVGTTSFVYTATGTQISPGQINIGSAGTGGSTLMNFGNGNGAVGSITVTGSATSYNTSSDYRLKNITGPLTGAKDFIMALKPKQGTWKVDGSAFVGFLAHEFQEVSPSSVSGEKDAVDVDGKPIMQAMQASSSEVMANLVAFIQEQQALITQLTARITALESA